MPEIRVPVRPEQAQYVQEAFRALQAAQERVATVVHAMVAGAAPATWSAPRLDGHELVVTVPAPPRG